MRHLILPILLAIVVLVAGCSKDGGDPGPVNALGPNAVADLAAAALGGESTQGASAQFSWLAGFSSGAGLSKGSAIEDVRPIDTTIVREKTEGLVTYRYVLVYRISLTNFGNRADVASTVSGTLSTPRLSSADSASSTIVVTHLADPDSSVSVNAVWHRTGLTQTKGVDPVSFSSTMDAVYTDVRVGKTSKEIESGSAVLTISGNLSTGGHFGYTINVTFLGGQQAVLAFAGSTYRVDLSTGAVVLAP